jgi:hypothetical protein
VEADLRTKANSSSCGLGFELALVLAALLGAGRRGRG